MEPFQPRRWAGTTAGRIVIAIAAIAAVGVVVWAARDGDDPRPVPPAVVEAAIPVDAPQSASSSPPREASTPAVVEAEHEGDQVQLCGGEWVNVGADGAIAEQDVEALNRRELQSIAAPTLALMLGSADERTRAAAQLLQAADVGAIETSCKGDSICTGSERLSHRAALARMARTSTDPQIYAWAYRSCLADALHELSECQQISVEQWARLDPGNATPWMYAAAEAKQRGDAAALDEAMFQVGSAERQDIGWAKLAATALERVPEGEDHLLGAEVLMLYAIGVDAATMVPYSPAMDFCNPRLLADANRRETCSRVAEVLVEHSTTFIDRTIGMGLGKRLGWTPERIRTLQTEADAMFEISRKGLGSHGPDRSCKAIAADLDSIREIAGQGEIGAAKSAIAASGKSIEMIAAEARKSRAAMVRAWAVASAASAAQVGAASRPPER